MPQRSPKEMYSLVSRLRPFFPEEIPVLVAKLQRLTSGDLDMGEVRTRLQIKLRPGPVSFPCPCWEDGVCALGLTPRVLKLSVEAPDVLGQRVTSSTDTSILGPCQLSTRRGAAWTPLCSESIRIL